MIMNVIKMTGIERKQVEFIEKYNDLNIFALKNKKGGCDELFIALDNKHIIGICVFNAIDNLKRKYTTAHIRNSMIDTFNRGLREGFVVSMGVAELLGRTEEAHNHNLAAGESIKKRRQEEYARRQAYLAEQERLEKEKHKQQVLEAKHRYYHGKLIDVDMFIELCKEYNIELPIKTIGWMRKHVGQIGKSNMSIDRDANRSTVIHKYTHQLYLSIELELYPQNMMEPGEYEEGADIISPQEMNALFGFGGYKGK